MSRCLPWGASAVLAVVAVVAVRERLDSRDWDRVPNRVWIRTDGGDEMVDDSVYESPNGRRIEGWGIPRGFEVELMRRLGRIGLARYHVTYDRPLWTRCKEALGIEYEYRSAHLDYEEYVFRVIRCDGDHPGWFEVEKVPRR